MTQSKLLPETPLLKIDGKSTRVKYLKKECELVKWKEKRDQEDTARLWKEKVFVANELRFAPIIELPIADGSDRR